MKTAKEIVTTGIAIIAGTMLASGAYAIIEEGWGTNPLHLIAGIALSWFFEEEDE